MVLEAKRNRLTIPPGVPVVSASQIQKAELCFRKWAFESIWGMREPQGRGAAHGDRVHAIHEGYLREGTAPDPNESWQWDKTPPGQTAKTFYPGRVALSMMPAGIYPAPRTGEVEYHFVFKREPLIWYQGLVDWHAYDRASRFLRVIDHKTSVDPQKYGLVTEAPDPEDDNPRGQLRADTQGVIYAQAMLDHYTMLELDAPPEHVEIVWNYGKADGAKKHAYTAHAEFDNVNEIYTRFEKGVHPIARELHRLKQLRADPLTLTPNPNACRMYNTLCPHFEQCDLSTTERLGALIMGKSLLNDLLAEAPGQPNPGAVAAAAPPTPPAPTAGDAVNPPESAGAQPTAPVIPIGAAPAPAPTLPVAPAGPPGPAAPTPPIAPVAAAPPAPAPAFTAPRPAPAPPALSSLAIPRPTAPAGVWDLVAKEVAQQIVASMKG